MSLGTAIYNVFLKRSSTFAVTIIGSAFVFERTFDLLSDAIFERINRGKLWKHIKHNYEK